MPPERPPDEKRGTDAEKFITGAGSRRSLLWVPQPQLGASCNPPRKPISYALAVTFPENFFPQAEKRCFRDTPGTEGSNKGKYSSFGYGPPWTVSPRASRLWLAPHGTQDSAEISKYWLWPQDSGCRNGKEKVWACETRGKTSRRNTCAAAADETDQAAMATPGPPLPVTMVQTPAAAQSVASHQPLRRTCRADWTTPSGDPEVSEVAAWLLGEPSRGKPAGLKGWVTEAS